MTSDAPMVASPLAVVVAVGSAVVVLVADDELPAGITFPHHIVSIWQPVPADISWQARCVDCHWVGSYAADHMSAWSQALLHGNTA